MKAGTKFPVVAVAITVAMLLPARPVEGEEAKPPAPAAAPVLLKWKFTAGEVFTYTVANTRVVKGEMGGQKMEVLERREKAFKFVVKEAKPDGSAVLELTTVKCEQAQEQEGREPRGWSSTKAEDLAARDVPPGVAVAADLDMPLTVTVDATGVIASVNGTDAVIERGLRFCQADLKKVGGEESPLIKMSPLGGLIRHIRSTFGEEGKKTELKGVLFDFPDKPLKVGDTWKEEVVTQDAEAGTLKETYSYALASVKDDQAIIQVEANLVLKGKDQEEKKDDPAEDEHTKAIKKRLKQMQGGEASIHVVTSTNLYQHTFDLKQGKLVDSQSSGVRKLRIDRENEPPETQEMSLSSQITFAREAAGAAKPPAETIAPESGAKSPDDAKPATGETGEKKEPSAGEAPAKAGPAAPGEPAKNAPSGKATPSGAAPTTPAKKEAPAKPGAAANQPTGKEKPKK
ncbi:MAG: hypothetical protein HY719_12880 [Planctomycetes bacterium]|nr:hypothetical protein [Planctomycetota bacterium]